MKFILGKFGLKHCDLPTMFSNVAFFLRYITINIDKKYSKRTPIICYVLVIITAACYIYLYIFSMLWFVFVRCRETGDFTAAAVVFSLGVISETCVTKYSFMIIYREKIQVIVQRYLECDSKVKAGTRYYDNLQKALLKIKRRVVLTWVFFVIMGISYATLPLLLPGRHFAEDMYVVYGLEPMFESPNYETALITQTLAVMMCNYIIAGVSAFILIIIGYIEAQILALSDEIIMIWDDAEKYYHNVTMSTAQNAKIKFKITNDHVEESLKRVIIYHTTLKNLLTDFEGLFRVTMAIEFLLLIIGIVAELLGRVENTFIELPDTFIQLFINCFIGQKLIDAGKVFEDAVYNCKWENFDKRNMTTILLILKNAQKPLKITAGGLTNLDFVCLMCIVKTTYSFYTTLKSTVG